MSQLEILTQKYADVFCKRDLLAVAALLHAETSLHDPGAGLIKGKAAVLAFVEGLFKAMPKMRFTANNILVTGDVASVLEFSLDTGEKVLQGWDIVLWDGGLIKEIRAYVY